MENNKLFKEIADVVLENVDETSRRRKAQMALNGKLANVKTICIMSAENPMGNALTPEENKIRRTELETYLTNAHFPWFRIKGKYGNVEKSHMIYNITLSDALELGKKYNQESIIFIAIENDGKVSYQYWDKGETGDYKKQHERNEYLKMDDADDFYSAISRSFKFQIPFFDGSDDAGNEMNEQISKLNEKVDSKYLSENDKERYFNNILNEDKTKKCRYESRGCLFGGWKIND